jgi:hypothetical protein
MKWARTLPLAIITLISIPAHADEPYNLGPGPALPPGTFATWGAGYANGDADSTRATREVPALRARDLLFRARWLDETAAADEKSAADLSARLPALRAAAQATRQRAERARTTEERELLSARAEDLETDVVVSESELSYRRRSAVDNRRMARDLRARAVRLAREPASADDTALVAACDPPFRFSTDGRKIYRLECLK